MGSDPWERMNTRGVMGEVSSNRVLRSIEGLSTNVLPRLTVTNSVTEDTTLGREGGRGGRGGERGEGVGGWERKEERL